MGASVACYCTLSARSIHDFLLAASGYINALDSEEILRKSEFVSYAAIAIQCFLCS